MTTATAQLRASPGRAAALATETGAGPSMFIVLVGFYGYIL